MKLHLLGASGSGVTTLGQSLATTLQLPYFDSDDYFWHPSAPPFTQRRQPEERNRLISADLSKANSWILGGSVIHWGDDVFPPFDLVVFLYLPPEIRIARLKQRELDRYDKVIYECAERQKQFNDFIAWAADYDHHSGIANRTLQAHKDWLSKLPQPVVELIGDLTVEERAEQVIAALQGASLLPTTTPTPQQNFRAL